MQEAEENRNNRRKVPHGLVLPTKLQKAEPQNGLLLMSSSF
jgi:hypothetical protein